MTAQPFAHTAGPKKAQVVFVGEAWGAEEAEVGLPFVGQSGREFARMLGEAWKAPTLLAAASRQDRTSWLSERESWLQEHGILLTNVFALRPANNNLAALCSSKEELPSDYVLGPVRTQSPRYVRAEYLGELARLREEACCVQSLTSWSRLAELLLGLFLAALALALFVVLLPQPH